MQEVKAGYSEINFKSDLLDLVKSLKRLGSTKYMVKLNIPDEDVEGSFHKLAKVLNKIAPKQHKKSTHNSYINVPKDFKTFVEKDFEDNLLLLLNTIENLKTDSDLEKNWSKKQKKAVIDGLREILLFRAIHDPSVRTKISHALNFYCLNENITLAEEEKIHKRFLGGKKCSNYHKDGEVYKLVTIENKYLKIKKKKVSGKGSITYSLDVDLSKLPETAFLRKWKYAGPKIIFSSKTIGNVINLENHSKVNDSKVKMILAIDKGAADLTLSDCQLSLWVKRSVSEVNCVLLDCDWKIQEDVESDYEQMYEFKNSAKNLEIYDKFARSLIKQTGLQPMIYKNKGNKSFSSVLVTKNFIFCIPWQYTNFHYPVTQKMVEDSKRFFKNENEISKMDNEIIQGAYNIENIFAELLQNKVVEFSQNYQKSQEDHLEAFTNIMKNYDVYDDLNESFNFLYSLLSKKLLTLSKQSRAEVSSSWVSSMARFRDRKFFNVDKTVRENLSKGSLNILDGIRIEEILHESLNNLEPINDENAYKAIETMNFHSRIPDIQNQFDYALDAQKKMSEEANLLLEDLRKTLKKKKVRNSPKKVKEWLEMEMYYFYQSYYINYEQQSVDFSRRRKLIIKDNAIEKPDTIIKNEFKTMYESYMNSLNGNVPYIDQVSEILKKVEKHKFGLQEKELHLKDQYEFSSEVGRYKFELGFGNKNKGIHRYLTDSYLNNFPKLENIYKQFISLESSIDTISKKLKAAKKANKKASAEKLQKEVSDIKKSQNSLIPEMRKWIIQQEMDLLLSIKINKGENGKSSWFFYPDFKRSLDKKLQLENVYEREWDNDINRIISQARNYAESYGPEFTDIFTKKIKDEIKKLKKTKTNSYRKEIYEVVKAFMEFEKSISFDRTFYTLSDALLRLCLLFKGIYPYADLGTPATYALARRDIKILLDFYNQSFKYTKDFFHINCAWSHLQTTFWAQDVPTDFIKDEIEKTGIGNILSQSTDIVEDIAKGTNNARFAMQVHPKLVIGSVCALNHFKNICKYLDLVEKYDLYEFNKSDSLIPKDVPKQDAAFMMRKRKKSKKISATLENYLKENKLPKYQNDNKYKELNKLINNGDLEISIDRGSKFIDRKSFINWLKNRKDYRRLNEIKKPALEKSINVEQIASLLA